MPTRQTTTLPDVTQFTVADGNWDTDRGPIMSIILHTMDGTVEGANARFNNPASQVSAHYGVGLDGKLYQWCDEDNVAYHSGNYHVNQTSIGIEHEDGGNYNDPRPDILYASSAKLVADICKFYQIPCDSEHIFKHSSVIDRTIYPGGTACPDALDTDRIISMANDILNPKPVTESQPTVTPTPPVVSESQDSVTIPTTPPVETQPPVENILAQPAEGQQPDNTETSTTSPTVPEVPTIPNWSPRQAILEAWKLLVRLLVWLELVVEVKE